MPIQSQQSCLVNGMKVQFERRGRGPAVVLVHGLLGYSFSWRHVLAPLSEEREVFALDMPGSGFSECHATTDAHLSRAAERLLKFLDVVGIGSCDLVGSSYGGTTALYLTATHPERIRTLTLVSPANPWSRIGRKRLALLGLPFAGLLFPPFARRIPALHRLSIRRMYGDQRRLSAETLRGYSLPLVRKGVFEHAVRIAHNWHSDMAALQRVLVGAAETPTLILWGSKDRLVELASAQVLNRQLKNSRLAVMDGAGHLPYEECPGDFLALVNAFLAEHSPVRVLDGK
ncbi:MAG TPA: alpha/beta hydrolase [Terriglobales bacterium]|nr:alpha/beta hydrolase [Terriglobales bacterium]